MTRLGRRLQRLRDEKGLSRRQLETQAEVPHGVVSRLESGEQAYPSVPVAMRLARVLGVTLDYLCGMYEGDQDSKGWPPHMADACRLTMREGPMPLEMAPAAV
jgi:transcriptional regulator with XRE-family HTH domain